MKYGGVKTKQMMFGGVGILVVIGIVLIILWQTGVIFKKAAPAAPGRVNPLTPPLIPGVPTPTSHIPLGPDGKRICDFSLENPSDNSGYTNLTNIITFQVRSKYGCPIPAGTEFWISDPFVKLYSVSMVPSSADPNVTAVTGTITLSPKFQGNASAQVIMFFDPIERTSAVYSSEFTIHSIV